MTDYVRHKILSIIKNWPFPLNYYVTGFVHSGFSSLIGILNIMKVHDKKSESIKMMF